MKNKTRGITSKQILALLEFHQKLGYSYKGVRTNSSMELESRHSGKVRTMDNSLPMGELIYIQLVKKYILENNIHKRIPKIKRKDIKYYVYSNDVKVGSTFKNCYEIDLKSAYWETGNMNNIIDPVIYNKAYQINPKTKKPFISKQVRLASLGSLAKVERRFEFNGTKTKTLPPKRTRQTEHIWDFICYKTSLVMQKCMRESESDFIFFWTDAIFVTSERAKNKVGRLLENLGYDYTVKPIQKIEFTQKDIQVKDRKEERPFPYTHRYRKY